MNMTSFFTLLCFLVPSFFAQDEGPEGPELLPGVGKLQFSINLFRGQPPSKQIDNFVGARLFTLTVRDPDQSLGAYYFYDQLEQLDRASSTCQFQSKSTEVSWSLSSSSLKRESQSSSDGYDQESTIGIEYEVIPGATASAETNIRNTLMFGNSQTSEESKSQSSRKYKYSIDTSSRRILYNVKVKWDRFNADTYDPYFKEAATNLGSNPSINDILKFWDEWGTHGIERVAMGQKCRANLYMEAGYTTSSYSNFNSQVSSTNANLLWWSSSSNSELSESDSQTYSNSFSYRYANRFCIGELDYDSACGGGMTASGITRPDIVEWTYKPMWEMNIPDLSIQAKNQMKQIALDIYGASVNCRNQHCNGRGNCSPRLLFWERPITLNTNQYNSLWDYSSKCFCDEGYIGDYCEHVRGSLFGFKRTDFDSWTPYRTYWDRTASGNSVICGLQSYHNNGHEDRKFKFRYCMPDTSLTLTKKYTGWHTRKESNEDWLTQCNDDNQFISHIRTWWEGDDYDRDWQVRCASYEGGYATTCTEYQDDWVNSWDKFFIYDCPWGYALSGIQSIHWNSRQDRKFKFKCCKVTVPAY